MSHIDLIADIINSNRSEVTKIGLIKIVINKFDARQEKYLEDQLNLVLQQNDAISH